MMGMTLPELRRTDPPSATEGVAKLRLVLNNLSLAELNERGIVTWDKSNHLVRKGPDFAATAAEVFENE
jgi:hypothetical protein